jgi:hypothetical protein
VGHGHHHTPTLASSAEGPLAPSHRASVVLDIGLHAGALVLYASEDLAGAEVEIRPGGGAWLGTHTAIRERHAGGRVLYAGVFGSLAENTYDLRIKGGGPESFILTVDVVAGAVTEVTLPSPPLFAGDRRP